jgi:phenylpropionate dioxygenase-like ring-hydroxylating dioxygenase large terminal subunit
MINILIINTSKIITKPSCNKYQNNIPLFWKIAKTSDIENVFPRRYIFNNFPISVYKDNDNHVKAVSDICVHRGTSLSKGKILKNNCLQCPYHGWEYKNGLVESMPGCPDITPGIFGVPQFEVKEINDDIYLRPTYDINSGKGNTYNHTIYIPPEATDDNFVRVSGYRHLQRPNNIVTENVLDMMHISYVHSFGNSLAPVPFKISYEDIDELSGKTTFHYTAGPSSMSRIIGGAKFVIVENEFHLPDVTVTRVVANDIIKTIVTHCYPIGKNESIIHFDLYRNFMTTNLLDSLFEYQMKLTLDEDVNILNWVYDDYMLGFMSNKYDITQIKYRKKLNRLLNIKY